MPISTSIGGLVFSIMHLIKSRIILTSNPALLYRQANPLQTLILVFFLRKNLQLIFCILSIEKENLLCYTLITIYTCEVIYAT